MEWYEVIMVMLGAVLAGVALATAFFMGSIQIERSIMELVRVKATQAIMELTGYSGGTNEVGIATAVDLLDDVLGIIRGNHRRPEPEQHSERPGG